MKSNPYEFSISLNELEKLVKFAKERGELILGEKLVSVCVIKTGIADHISVKVDQWSEESFDVSDTKRW